jgi:hypothetical protein
MGIARIASGIGAAVEKAAVSRQIRQLKLFTKISGIADRFAFTQNSILAQNADSGIKTAPKTFHKLTGFQQQFRRRQFTDITSQNAHNQLLFDKKISLYRIHRKAHFSNIKLVIYTTKKAAGVFRSLFLGNFSAYSTSVNCKSSIQIVPG